MSKYYNDPERRRAYLQHAKNAKHRGLEFTLTFEQWCDAWGDKFDQRGSHVGQYNMCRSRDEGGYTLGNVRIATVTENQHEKGVAMRVRAAQRPTTVPRGYINRPPDESGWLLRDAFAPYSEEEEDETSDTC